MQTALNLKVIRDKSFNYVGREYTPSKEPVFRKALKEARADFVRSGAADEGKNELFFVISRIKDKLPYDRNVKQKCLRRMGYIEPEKRVYSNFDLKLRDLYYETVRKNKKRQKQIDYILEHLEEVMPEEFAKHQTELEEKIRNLISCYRKRYKRFFHKARLNRFTHFATFTYDDALHDEESFVAQLKMTLAHFANRRGWRYIYCFERGEIGGRLHVHALISIPKGEMVGEIKDVKHYSVKSKGFYTMRQNSFFRENFGENDFSPLDEDILRLGDTLRYIVKYCFKQGDYAHYSRHLPTALEEEIPYEYLFNMFEENGNNYTFRTHCFGFGCSEDISPAFLRKDEVEKEREFYLKRRETA